MRLQRRADRDRVLGIDVRACGLREELADLVADVRDLRRATDEDHVVDPIDAELRVGERLLADRERAVDDVGHLRDKLVARDLDL